jgi:hypothetical protein
MRKKHTQYITGSHKTGIKDICASSTRYVLSPCEQVFGDSPRTNLKYVLFILIGKVHLYFTSVTLLTRMVREW